MLFLALKSGRIWYEPGFEEMGRGAGEMARAVAVRSGEERCTPILGPGLIESLLG